MPDIELLFQSDPLYFKPSIYRAKGWTESICGYLAEAKKLTTCLLKNNQTYKWHLTINMEEVMPAEQAAALWAKVCRNLRRHGLVAIWIREISASNKLHCHLLVINPISEKQLSRIAEVSIPKREQPRWHKRVQAIDDDPWYLLYYVTKAKISCTLNGKLVDDLYRDKRLLFRSGLGLRKYGTIGPFWQPSKKKIWDEVCEENKGIAEGMKQPFMKQLVEAALDLVSPSFTRKQVERRLGFFAHTTAVKNWVDQLISDGVITTA